MMQPHLKINKIKKYVLLPGDPGRLDKIGKYLSNTKELNFNREFRSLSGEYEGIKISAVSTGIGCPGAAIAVEELARIGAKVLIRVGTCGGLLKEMQPGDIVIPNAAMCFDGTTKEYNPDTKKVEASKRVVKALIESTKKFKVKYYVGVNRTHDAFYEPIENFVKLAGQGFISSEMECSAIFLVSKLRNLEAGAILVVNTPEPPEEVMKNPEIVCQLVDENRVKQGIDNAIKIALEAVKTLEKKNYERD
ncbi:nucleoside phosphorylase [bacterium]|nr:nucleoside phosphorylase [bacterium]